MDKRFTILDERGAWFNHACAAARNRGYEAQRITRGAEARPGGLGFIRPHAIPAVLQKNQFDYEEMATKLVMVQDRTQVELYEDKSAQFWRFKDFLPPTWRFDNREMAVEFARRHAPYPIVSKADVGASSVNVRILPNQAALLAHIQMIWKGGIVVDHCAGGGRTGQKVLTRQKNYVLLQEFIPGNEFTWRINIIGTHIAGFRRFNFPDRPVAQTGNVQPVMSLNDHPDVARVFEFARTVGAAIGSKWVALDILTRGSAIFLLETSLAWPWPSPGTCMDAPFFAPDNTIAPRKWSAIWDLMLDEYEAGVWTNS